MTEDELAALTVLVQSECFEMQAENRQREMNGEALAYVCFDGPYKLELEKELRGRGIIK